MFIEVNTHTPMNLKPAGGFMLQKIKKQEIAALGAIGVIQRPYDKMDDEDDSEE